MRSKLNQLSQERAPVVHIRNLLHRHSKDGAVREVSFDIPESGTVSCLGSNGASKSTCMNIMCGVLFTAEGDVLIEGWRRQSWVAKPATQ